jgi:hypothetical protein
MRWSDLATNIITRAEQSEEWKSEVDNYILFNGDSKFDLIDYPRRFKKKVLEFSFSSNLLDNFKHIVLQYCNHFTLMKLILYDLDSYNSIEL